MRCQFAMKNAHLNERCKKRAQLPVKTSQGPFRMCREHARFVSAVSPAPTAPLPTAPASELESSEKCALR